MLNPGRYQAQFHVNQEIVLGEEGSSGSVVVQAKDMYDEKYYAIKKFLIYGKFNQDKLIMQNVQSSKISQP